jgi:vacuolar-type H+-ATPase subunit H
MEEPNESVENAYNEYYKLKNKYETEIMKNKKKILNNPSLSAKEKRSEFLKLKPKCINCKRPGGTIFSTKYYSENTKKGENNDFIDDYRQLSARCGIIADPCNLNINIHLGTYELLPDILENIEKEIKDNKNEIIDSKNKLLFGYITTETALQNYDSIKDYVSHFTSLLEQYLKIYLDITDNLQKKQLLNEDIERTYEIITEIKQCIISFNELESTQYVRDAVHIYITNLLPLLNKISNLKYKQNFVYYDEDLNTYNLIQKKYKIENLEYTSFNNSIVSYDVGLKIKKDKKAALIIVDSDTTSLPTIIEPNIQTNQTNQTNENDSIPLSKIEGVYNGNIVTWNNSKYQELWDKLPEKFKKALTNNSEWMNEFMYSCIIAKSENKNCRFVAPKNLIVPPELSENNDYNFGQGNEAYNTLFNNLDKTYQNTLLTLYSEKNGVKNYSMFIDTLNKLLAKDLGFENGYF